MRHMSLLILSSDSSTATAEDEDKLISDVCSSVFMNKHMVNILKLKSTCVEMGVSEIAVMPGKDVKLPKTTSVFLKSKEYTALAVKDFIQKSKMSIALFIKGKEGIEPVNVALLDVESASIYLIMCDNLSDISSASENKAIPVGSGLMVVMGTVREFDAGITIIYDIV